jgi:hypothetical protein
MAAGVVMAAGAAAMASRIGVPTARRSTSASRAHWADSLTSRARVRAAVPNRSRNLRSRSRARAAAYCSGSGGTTIAETSFSTTPLAVSDTNSASPSCAASLRTKAWVSTTEGNANTSALA